MPASTAAEPETGERPPVPGTLRIAAVIEAIEAAGVLAAAILAGVDTGQGRSYQLSSGIAITVIGAATAIGLALVGWGLLQARRWTRTPSLLTQLFAGIVGMYLLTSDRYSWGVPAVVLAAGGFVALFAPRSTKVLTAALPQPASRGRSRPSS